MDLTILFVVALTIVTLIAAVAEVIKNTFNINARYMPMVSLIIGIVVGLILYPLSDYNAYIMAVAGGIAGLSASGAFDLLKAAKRSDAK